MLTLDFINVSRSSDSLDSDAPLQDAMANPPSASADLKPVSVSQGPVIQQQVLRLKNTQEQGISDSAATLGGSNPNVRYASNRHVRREVRIAAWEGVVEDVFTDEDGEDCFRATLTDMDGKQTTHIAEFPCTDVPEADRTRLVSGAVFYWYITQVTLPSGTVRKESEIQLREYPRTTKRGAMRNEQELKDLQEFFGVSPQQDG